MAEDRDPLISVPTAAKAIGLDRSTLSKQVRAGVVRSHGGKVRLSEVLADRAANIDLGRSKRRQGAIDEPERTSAPIATRSTEELEPDDDGGEVGEPVIVDGAVMSYAEARALKETYLARLRRLEYDLQSGQVVLVEKVVSAVAAQLAIVRNRLLGIPSRLAPQIASRRWSSPEAHELVLAEVSQALTELSSPEATLGRLAPHAGPSPRRGKRNP